MHKINTIPNSPDVPLCYYSDDPLPQTPARLEDMSPIPEPKVPLPEHEERLIAAVRHLKTLERFLNQKDLTQ